MTILLHPTAARAAPLAPPPLRMAGQLPTYGLFDVARRLGARGEVQALVRQLRVLIRIERFPAPLPGVRGTATLTGEAAVRATARWDRRAVDAWFDGLLPPGAREALLDTAEREAAAALDANAGQLDQLLARRRRA